MSKANPTLKQLMLEREAEVKSLEIQARYWKAQFELREYYLKSKSIEGQYNEVFKEEMAEYLKKQQESQETFIKEVEPQES